MNELQLRLVAGAVLIMLTLVHILATAPPLWIAVTSGLIGMIYYFGQVWFMFRYPLQLVIWLFEAMIVIGYDVWAVDWLAAFITGNE